MNTIEELVRVQLLLGKDDNEALVDEARRRGISKSECVRQLIRQNMDVTPDGEDSFLSFTFGVETEGPTDVSTHHDTYVYGGEMKP